MASSPVQFDFSKAVPAPAETTPPPSAAPPKPQSHGLAAVADWMEGQGTPTGQLSAATNPAEARVAGGALRSAQGGVGHLLSILSKANMPTAYSVSYQQEHPGSTEDDAKRAYADEYKKTFGGHISQHLQDAANWLKTGTDTQGFMEATGALGEQMLELMGPEGALKLTGKLAEAAEATKGAGQAAEKLKNAHLVTKTMMDNPIIAGLISIAGKAGSDAALMGGQTYAHTEDPVQAQHAAELGAGARVAGETVINPLAKKAAQWVGERQAIPQRLRSLAQQATQNIMDRINATRPNFAATEDASRMLPAGEGSQPFTFTDLGTPTQETQEGPLTQEPRKKQTGTKVVEPRAEGPEKGPEWFTGAVPEGLRAQSPVGSNVREINPATGEGPALPENKPVSTNAQKLVKEPTFQYMSGTKPGSPEARGDVVTGGANRTTTNPAEAQRWLSDLEDLQDSPEHDSLSQDQKDAIEQRRASLQDQIGMYHASPYVGRFAPVDVESILDHVHDFRDVGNQAEAAVKPVYDTMDRLTDGRFNALNQQFKNAQRSMVRPRTVRGYEAAQKRSEEALQGINEIFTRNAGEVSREDYQAAVRGWRDRSQALQLHTAVQRAIEGHAEDLGELLDKKAGDINGLIGADGINNLRQLGDLMAKRSKETKEVANNVALEWGRHGLRVAAGGAPGVVGGYIAHQMGMPAYWGMAAGGLAGQGMRRVLNMAATNPRVGTLVDYAVRNGVSPKVYAPLITRAIMVPQQEQKQPEEGQQ